MKNPLFTSRRPGSRSLKAMIAGTGSWLTFFPQKVLADLGDASAITKIDDGGGGGGPDALKQLIKELVIDILGFVGLIAVVVVIIGGIYILVSAGNDTNVEKGKKAILYALIGVVIILLSAGIVNLVLGV